MFSGTGFLIRLCDRGEKISIEQHTIVVRKLWCDGVSEVDDVAGRVIKQTFDFGS